VTTHDAVTDSHEPSYYEIALTNRQVLVAFVVLLLCMLGAFFSGVWVGRGASPTKSPVQAAKPVPPDGPLEEYAFFSDDAKGRPAAAQPTAPAAGPKPGPSPPAATPTPPGTTLMADLGAKPSTPPAGPESMGEAGEPPLPANDAAASPPAGSASEQPAAPKPAAPEPAAPKPAATPPAPTRPNLAADEMVVQVFSSSDLAQARSIMERLRKGGYNAFLSPVEVGSQTMQRVRIGPYTDRARAQRVADEVKKKFRLDSWITR
jgi:cell division septation protein DedD